MRRVPWITVLPLMALLLPSASSATDMPLRLEATIPLAGVSGRIDHLAIDLGRKRLFVVELGNGSVDVVDLAARKVIYRISGLKEPQGVAYSPMFDMLVVACGGDGVVRIYSGGDFSARGEVKLGDDADNAHLDHRNGHVIVGYGTGGLAIIDPAKSTRLADIRLPAHPEGFATSPSGSRAYVNVPDAGQIDVVELDSGRLVTRWRPARLSSNFPIAVDGSGDVAVVFRAPPELALVDSNSGQFVATSKSCGDADDVFFDAKRKRIYLSCGAGAVDVLEWAGHNLHLLTRVSTSWGARTSLFVPEFDRLFVAARGGLLGSDAAIQVYRPVP
jgi:YVTN family beta-propeller protein